MFHALSGILELIQRGVLVFGVGIIRSKDLRSFGPASAMYLLWKATPDELTPRAKIPSSVSSFRTLAMPSTDPEI